MLWNSGYVVMYVCYYIVALQFHFIAVLARLYDGHNSRSGRVEIYINGQWGTVCDDDWTTGSSTVVCRQLGLGSTGTFNQYGTSSADSPIHLDDVRCDGSEPNILACSHSPISVQNCNHNKDVGVTCSGFYSQLCSQLCTYCSSIQNKYFEFKKEQGLITATK